MPRPKASPEQHTDAYRLYRAGKGPKGIYDALCETFPDNTVSERTVATWVRDFKALNPEVVSLDSLFLWHQMEASGLPWEASTLLLDILYAIEKQREEDIAMAERIEKMNPGVMGFVLPRLTVREARWCWRVHLATPEVGATVGNTGDVYMLAKKFAYREMAADVLGEPLQMEDLEALLVYKPWLDFGGAEERHQDYHRAADDEAITPLAPHRDVIAMLANALKGTADEVLDVVKRGISAGSDIAPGHDELLASQQAQLVRELNRAAEKGT